MIDLDKEQNERLEVICAKVLRSKRNFVKSSVLDSLNKIEKILIN